MGSRFDENVAVSQKILSPKKNLAENFSRLNLIGYHTPLYTFYQ